MFPSAYYVQIDPGPLRYSLVLAVKTATRLPNTAKHVILELHSKTSPVCNCSMIPWVLPTKQCRSYEIVSVFGIPSFNRAVSRYHLSSHGTSTKLGQLEANEHGEDNSRRTTCLLQGQLRRIGRAVAPGGCEWGVAQPLVSIASQSTL
jgi:hypothetical protein